MAIKLYQRQNPTIQGIGIIQPQQSNMGSQIASGLNTYANKIQRAAEDNFALGKAQVINDITTQAYEIAPDDVAKFNELVEKGLQKSFKGLPDDVQTKKTKKIIAKARKNKNIIFIGRLEHSEALRVMSTFDVLVHPTYRDGFGTTIEEAMAMGIPCITTDIPGPSEVLENEVNGLLVKVKDTQSLLSAMERYLLDENLRKEHGKKAYEYATEHYGIEKCTKEYVDYLEKLVLRDE